MDTSPSSWSEGKTYGGDLTWRVLINYSFSSCCVTNRRQTGMYSPLQVLAESKRVIKDSGLNDTV